MKHAIPLISLATEKRLIDFLHHTKPKHVLEVWTAVWYSTRCIAQTIAQREWHITSFEISYPSYITAVVHLDMITVHNHSLYFGNVLTLPLSSLLTSAPDLIFIDAAKSEYLQYLSCLHPYMGEHTSIVCDDVIHYRTKVWNLEKRYITHWFHTKSIDLDDWDGLILAYT